ncbi:Metallo-dependent phosphatase-like protein [Xylariaceae sp. FL1272]|nr:Metallo-dependent phosphatase-like protein [Xylariaceae sp. FL1272]
MAVRARSTRFLILSDTHDDAFPSNTSKADVVLHCGDLTLIGGLSNYRRAIKEISRIEAELKLIIAGNHDVSLDPAWWAQNLDEDDDLEESPKARALFSAEQHNGIHLLDEGTHTFTLSNGTSFTIYCSPFTPEFNGYAFAYPPHEDRFNHGKRPIPEGVDIVMTHGPPAASLESLWRLDANSSGEHCGCPNLLQAVARARPKLHCFGHIHEGYGAQAINWSTNILRDYEQNQILNISRAAKDETLFVNAAIMTGRSQSNNKPWIVDMERCQTATEDCERTTTT